MRLLVYPLGTIRQPFRSRLKSRDVQLVLGGLFVPMIAMTSVVLYYWNARNPVVLGAVTYLPTYNSLTSFCSSHACRLRPDVALSQTLLNGLIVLGLSLITTGIAIARRPAWLQLKLGIKLGAFFLFLLVGTSLGVASKFGWIGGAQTLTGAIFLLFIDCIIWMAAFSTIFRPSTSEVRVIEPVLFRTK